MECDEHHRFAPARHSQKSAVHTLEAWEHLSGKHVESDGLVEHVHHFLALDAASTGKGVALAEERLVRADIASGRVVAPIGFTRVADGFRVALMPRAYARPAITPLLNWLAAETSRDNIAGILPIGPPGCSQMLRLRAVCRASPRRFQSIRKLSRVAMKSGS